MARVGQHDPDWADRLRQRHRGHGPHAAPSSRPPTSSPRARRRAPAPEPLGAGVPAAARAGVIEAAGVAQSKRATVHRSLCRAWQGTAEYRREAAA
jgi:hypothetical protein